MDQPNAITDIENLLQSFEPAPAACQSADVVYQAGFEAGKRAAPEWNRAAGFFAATSGILATALTATIAVLAIGPSEADSPADGATPAEQIVETQDQPESLPEVVAPPATSNVPAAEAMASVAFSESSPAYLRMRASVLENGVGSLPASSIRSGVSAPTARQLHSRLSPATRIGDLQSISPIWLELLQSGG